MMPLGSRLAAFLMAIDRAREAAEAGNVLDLAGLDDTAAEICAATMALPASERPLAAEKLAAIGQALDGLAKTIAHNARASESLNSRSARAGRAYRASSRPRSEP